MKRFLVDAMITNKTTGRSINKAFTVTAPDQQQAIIDSFNYKGNAESMVVIRCHEISDFSHPMGF